MAKAVGNLSDLLVRCLTSIVPFHIKARGGKSKVIVYRSRIGMGGNDHGKVAP